MIVSVEKMNWQSMSVFKRTEVIALTIFSLFKCTVIDFWSFFLLPRPLT